MLIPPAFRQVILVLTALLLLFSCSGEGDKRKAVRDDLGEPDLIVPSEFAGMKIELYVYARKDINRAYEFRKTVSSGGRSEQTAGLQYPTIQSETVHPAIQQRCGWKTGGNGRNRIYDSWARLHQIARGSQEYRGIG